MEFLHRGGDRGGTANKRWMLRQISVFSDLSDKKLDFVSARARLVEFAKGERVYAQGEPPDAFYCILSGRVRIFAEATGTAKPRTLELLHRGAYFGVTSQLTSEAHHFSAAAVNDSILFRIDSEHFSALLKEIPEIGIHLSTTLSRQLRQKDDPKQQVYESILISLYSPLQYMGQTLYAVNLAAAIVHEAKKRVLLVDMSPSADVICKRLGLDRCVSPLRPTARTESSQIQSAIMPHPTIGVDVLSIAHDPQKADDTDHITPVLSYLTNLYHVVIIDLPHQMNRTVFKVLVQADRIHLLCDAHVGSLQTVARLGRDLKKTIQQAEERICLIVNEISGDVETNQRAILAETKVYNHLPAATEQPEDGHPIVLAHPEAPYARVIRRIAREAGGVLVGLALGSGAALGLAHIGILKIFEREKIPIDIIAGSSMGALIGALWASARSSADIEAFAKEFPSAASLLKIVELTIPKSGIFTGRRITKYLARHIGPISFSDLTIPLKVTAVDYQRREVLFIDEGSVVDAVRASISIPGIFEPFRIGNRWMIDGGVLDPVPVDILRAQGVNKIIAVNTLPSPADMQKRQGDIARHSAQAHLDATARGGTAAGLFWLKRLWWNFRDPNIFDVLVNTIQAMEYELAEVSCGQADVALRPTLGNINWWEFHQVGPLVQRGEDEALKHLPEIKKLLEE